MRPKHCKTRSADYWIYNSNTNFPVLIMVHGLRGTHHGLDLAARNLDKFRVIIPDLPGFGESEQLSVEHSVKNYVKWLKKFLEDLELKEVPTLLGHSFGSIIASHYAKKYPKTISKLILINPIGASVLEGARGLTSRIAVAYYWLGKVLPEPIGTKLLKSKVIVAGITSQMVKTKDKDLRKFIHQQHLEHFSSFKNKKVVHEAFLASINNNVKEVATDIKVPTLIIAGDIDDITPIKKQRELVKLFDNANYKELRGVGHLTHYEKPDIIADEINAFLS